MNNLQNMKKYQSNSETGLSNDDQFNLEDKKNQIGENENDEEFIDLSNI